ncbi:MAG: hypothetical protein V5A23_09905 [Halobacteriales archaeon]
MGQTTHRETLVACDACGAAQVAYVADDGGISVNGQTGCRRCGGEDFTELVAQG